MNRVIGKTGELTAGTAPATRQRGYATVVIKSLPADICDSCGEYRLSEEMRDRLVALTESAANKGAEVVVLRWVA